MASHYPEREEIEKRAYQLYCERGGEDGRDVEDWTRAERELIARSNSGQRSANQPISFSPAERGQQNESRAKNGAFSEKTKPGPEPVAHPQQNQKSAAAGRNKQ